MSNCYLRSWNYKNYRKHEGKFSLVSAGISLRSGSLTHSEIQLSPRYKNVSVSSTMADGCGCVRFKWIGYSNAKNWWDTRILPMTDVEEDAILAKALKDADVPPSTFDRWLDKGISQVLYGPNAKKYDTVGVSISFIIPNWRLFRPHAKWVWCSEECKELIGEAYPWFKRMYGNGVLKLPDETTPYTLDWEVGRYIGTEY